VSLRTIALSSSFLLGRRNLYRMSRFLTMCARGDVPNDLEANGETLVQEFAMKCDSSPSIVFDIGANLGNWTASLLQHSKGKAVTVHAFEPCQGTYERLAQRVKEECWTNVLAIPQGCARTPSTSRMRVYSTGAGTNTLIDFYESASANVETVDLTSVDEYSLRNGIGYIDLLKIDAEGFDFEVIAGATRMLKRNRVRLLQFEYNQRWIGARHYLRDAFLLLGPMGYQIGKLVGTSIEFYSSWHWELETYREGNYVACLKDVADRLPQRTPSWLPDAC